MPEACVTTPPLPPIRKGGKFFGIGATKPAMRERQIHSIRADFSTPQTPGAWCELFVETEKWVSWRPTIPLATKFRSVANVRSVNCWKAARSTNSIKVAG